MPTFNQLLTAEEKALNKALETEGESDWAAYDAACLAVDAARPEWEASVLKQIRCAKAQFSVGNDEDLVEFKL